MVGVVVWWALYWQVAILVVVVWGALDWLVAIVVGEIGRAEPGGAGCHCSGEIGRAGCHCSCR